MKNFHLSTTYMTARYSCCTFSLILDKRHPKKDKNTLPVAMRYTINRKSWYHYVEGEYTIEEFSKICNLNTKSVRSELYSKKLQFDSVFNKYKELIEHLGSNLTLEKIKAVITGEVSIANTSFIDVWKRKIKELSTNGRFTTGESYECALKSFLKILWKQPVEGFHIDKSIIERWNEGMMEGVKDRDGELVGKISDTTRGIYLRSARVIWNECVKLGYLANTEYPFSNRRDMNLVSIPKGNTRRAEFLDVDKMTTLYKTFIGKKYPESWPSDFTPNVHYSLGLFLVQYLCNGFNLVDEAGLTYDDYYYSTNGKAFRFSRKKTAGRSEEGAEVIIPIIEPLKKVLDEIAAPPQKGALVFPDILKDAKTDEEIRRRTTQENQNVRKRLQILCKDALGWEEKISGTWARHSFATNMRNAGVDMQYISESMGHSTQKSVTVLYLASYPLDKQFEYNSRLLNLDNKPTKADIKQMTKAELQDLLLKML